MAEIRRVSLCFTAKSGQIARLARRGRLAVCSKKTSATSETTTAEGGTSSGRRCPTAFLVSRREAESQALLTMRGASSALGQVEGPGLNRQIAAVETSTDRSILRLEEAEVLSRDWGSAGRATPIAFSPSGVGRPSLRRQRFSEACGRAAKTCRCILADGPARTEI